MSISKTEWTCGTVTDLQGLIDIVFMTQVWANGGYVSVNVAATGKGQRCFPFDLNQSAADEC